MLSHELVGWLSLDVVLWSYIEVGYNSATSTNDTTNHDSIRIAVATLRELWRRGANQSERDEGSSC